MAAIFISYRRSDAGGHAGRLFDRLRHWFDDGEVFFDVDGIDAGQAFPQRLDEAVRSARVVLALIGPDWLASLDERAGKGEVDYVRREVALALKLRAERGAPAVIPVLFGGAAPPKREAFAPNVQADLGALGTLDAHEFRGKQDDWDNQFVRLRNLIAQAPGVRAPRFRAPAGTQRPFRVIDHAVSPYFQDPDGLLARLRASLDRGAAAVVARAALYGMGGVGKTQLALKYSHEYRDAYAGVWWFRAEAEATLQLDARDACIEVAAHVNEGELPSSAFRRWLGAQPGIWLLVFDNAEDPAALRPNLPDGGRHHVIVTSRNPAWGGLAQPVELDVWTAQQAAHFLGQRLPGSAPADRLDLARDLGGLPLALEQAASYIESTGVTLAAYRALLAGIDTGGLALDEGRAATGYERSVAATLSLAFERLSPAAAQLLRLCAFAAPEPLPERFFLEARDALPAELGAAAASPLDWNRVVGALRRFGLADRVAIAALDRASDEVAERSEQALGFHRLTQQVTRARSAEPAADCRVFQAVLRAACPEQTDLPGNWPRLAALSQHVTQLDRFSDAGWIDMGSFSWLLDRIASYLRLGPALLAESAGWYRRALAIDRLELGEEHPHTSTSMNNLAVTLQAQGDRAGARVLQEQVLAVRRRVRGDEHPDTLTAMNNLACTLWAQGDLPGARLLEEQALEIRRRVQGDEHLDTLIAMNNLASTLRAQGDLRGARALQEQALAVRRRVLGEAHPDTLTSMNNLALTQQAQGNLSGARALQEQVVAVRCQVQGEEHPDTLTAMNNLGGTQRAQGDLAGARVLEDRVLAIRRRVLGEEHPDTLGSMSNLASTLSAQGDLPGARTLEEQALAVRRKVLGERHPDTLAAMNNLGLTLQKQGDLPGAQTLQEQVVAISREVLSEVHPDTLVAINNLSLTLQAQGDLPGARSLQEQVLAGRRWALGEAHPDTLRSMNNLAATLWNLNERTAAHELMQAAAGGLAKMLGREHPDAQTSAHLLAQMREALNLPAQD